MLFTWKSREHLASLYQIICGLESRQQIVAAAALDLQLQRHVRIRRRQKALR